MPRTFTITNGYRPKASGRYPWPCAGQLNRTIELHTSDVLTKHATDGTWTKHTGLGCFGIELTDAQVEPIGKPVQLQLG